VPSSDVPFRIATAFADAGWVIVSGMAKGIDSLAHTACLKAGRPTIAFLGNGVDVTYPPSAKALRLEISRMGALISEYSFGVRINENRLRRRNSLIAGHSRAVVVIQSIAEGGAMNAVRAAERMGKPVFCIEPLPGFEAEFSGNAELLRSGRACPISPEYPVASVQSVVN